MGASDRDRNKASAVVLPIDRYAVIARHAKLIALDQAPVPGSSDDQVDDPAIRPMTEATMRTVSDTLTLARSLADPTVLGHAVTDVEVIETHISVVLLAGLFAYKLRKPVRMPFLDFRRLAARKLDCERELALNRRWAPGIYRAVITIHGSPSAPSLHAPGPVFDYAVQMMRFPDEARLDRVLTARGIDDTLAENLAASVAQMHLASPVATRDSRWGRPKIVGEQVQGNLDTLAEIPLASAEKARLRALAAYSLDEQKRLEPALLQRREMGMVRECHGDLHLANLVLLDGRVLPFDGVEFREDFRWVDIISDLAFLLMDLHRTGHSRVAWRVLNHWLETTVDHAGLEVLRHYLVYRALVRAKVEAIRWQQLDDGAHGDSYRSVVDYLVLAEHLSEPGQSRGLVITHGVSGSGKSFLARQLVPELGAVLLRSDVERKRLYPDSCKRYTAAATDQVYQHLLNRGEQVLRAGYPVILDATFLKSRWRAEASRVANTLKAPLRILSVDAPRTVLESRITARLTAGNDASEADLQVLDRQLLCADALTESERGVCVNVDSSGPVDPATVTETLRLARIPLPDSFNSLEKRTRD